MNGINKVFYKILLHQAELLMSALRAGPTQSSPPVFTTFRIVTYYSK